MSFVQQLKSLDEIVDYANGLDKASLVPVYHSSGDESRFRVIKNLNNGEEVCTVSDRYQVLQHSDALNLILSGIQGAGITGSGLLRNYGNQVVVETYFDNLTIRDHSQDGNIQLGFRFTNSFNKALGFNADIFAWRQVCQNGMLGTKLLPNAPEIHFKHMGDVRERITNAIKGVVEGLVKRQGSILEIINESRQEIIRFEGHEQVIKFLAQYVGSEKQATMCFEIENIELEMTRFSLYNCLTSFVSHKKDLSYNQYSKIHEKAQDLLINPFQMPTFRQAEQIALTV